jgi:hypothetical protein
LAQEVIMPNSTQPETVRESGKKGEGAAGVAKTDAIPVATSGAASDTANEGEGNKTAARRYNEATEKFVRSGRVAPAAKEAEEALEGEEGDELREAEEEGRRGEPEGETP